MSPKEKAMQLIEEFSKMNSGKLSDYTRIYYPTAKMCAIRTVNEVLNSHVGTEKDNYDIYFYTQVKYELENL